jgi:hypothetical protein
MSNVYATLSQASNKLSALQSIASIAAAQIEAGAQSHGTGAILEVALIASAITQGALTYTVAGKSDTFDKAKAIAAARVIYNRYAREYGEGDAGSFPFGADGKELNAWRNRTVMMLHPYTYNKTVYEWTKVAKPLTQEIMDHFADEEESEQETIRKLIMDALDKTDKVRAAAKKLWDLACLYVALDDNGALLQNSNTDPKQSKAKDFGLKMRIAFFIPYKRISNDPEVSNEVLLAPVDRRSGALYHHIKTSTGTQGEAQETRVSLNSFGETWKLPMPKRMVATNPWVDAVRLLNTLTPDMDLHPDAIELWDDMMVKVIAFNDALNIKRHGAKPEPEVDVETLSAKDIAEGKSLPSRMRVVN